MNRLAASAGALLLFASAAGAQTPAAALTPTSVAASASAPSPSAALSPVVSPAPEAPEASEASVAPLAPVARLDEAGELTAAGQRAGEPHEPITGQERVDWTIRSTVGVRSLGVGLVSAGWNTAWNRPEEYHGTWEGFGKRYAVRLSGVAIGNGMEAGLGALWGEDPRYARAADGGAWQRIGHAARLTVMARNRDGRLMPAYARYAGTVGNNFITNAWRPDSESTVGSALSRSALGISGRLVSNLFEEFWPDLRRRVSRDRP